MPTEAEERNEHNRKVIEEFRASGGKSAGLPTLLLTTTGAKSGQKRIAPLAYKDDGDRLLIVGSRAGSDKHPDWYFNLLKNPRVSVEVGAETYDAEATPLAGEERDKKFAEYAAAYSIFAEYQTRTKRVLPVIALKRVS